jgi:hypothetical protein
MTIPPSEHKHGVLVNDSCVAESVERYCAVSIDPFPLVALVLDRALVKIVEARLAVVAAENVQRAVVLHAGVVSPLRRLFALSFYFYPLVLFQIVHEKIVVVIA